MVLDIATAATSFNQPSPSSGPPPRNQRCVRAVGLDLCPERVSEASGSYCEFHLIQATIPVDKLWGYR